MKYISSSGGLATALYTVASLEANSEGCADFKRSYGDYWIIWHEKLRWIAGTWDSDEVFGRPWDQLAEQSKVSPPEGVWVSRKSSKSYAYELVYVETS